MLFSLSLSFVDYKVFKHIPCITKLNFVRSAFKYILDNFYGGRKVSTPNSLGGFDRSPITIGKGIGTSD